MTALWDHRTGLRGLSLLTTLARLVLLLLPTGLLVVAGLRTTESNLALWLAAGFQACVCVLSFLSRQSWQQPTGPSVIVLYLIALAGLWWGDNVNDWFTSGAKAFLL